MDNLSAIDIFINICVDVRYQWLETQVLSLSKSQFLINWYNSNSEKKY